MTPAGIITTVAGNGTGGSSGDGGHGHRPPRLDEPTGVAVDASGDIFIADSYNNEIREVTTDGIIHLFAGTGTVGNTGDGGQATSAQIHDPYMVAIYGGNVYFTDFGNNKVREVTTDGVIHTVAGTGTGGDTGDGGLATAAEIDGPIGLAFNALGDLFIANYDDSTVREVTTDGNIHTVAGSHDAFEYGSSKGDGGPGSAAGFYYLQGLAVDASGNLYIADNYNASIRELGPTIGVNVLQAPATHFTVTASPANATAGMQQTLTVTALDADGNVVTGYAGTVHITSSDGQAVLPPDATLTSGVGSFSVTLKTAGSDSITAADTVTPAITGSDSGINVTAAAASQLVVTGGLAAVAGGVETLTVTALDPYGNVATDYAGTVHVTSTDGQAVLPPDATLTSGVGSFSVTLKTAGSDSITATDTVLSGIAGTESGLVVTPGASSHFVVTGGSAVVAGGVETLTVTAEDTYGNVATGYAGTVHITSTDGQAVLPPDATLTSGVGSFSVTLKTAGSDSITATDTVLSGIAGTESGLVVTPDAATHFTVTGGSSETAGGVETLTVTALDPYGNVATGYTGTVHITSSDEQAVLPPNATLTSGVGTFPVTLKTAGSGAITAADTVTPAIAGSQTGIVVSAAAATHFTVTGGSSETAGGVETLTVTALDTYGNVATGYTGTVHITSSDGQAVLPPNAILTSGVGTFQVTLKTAGSESITATDTVSHSITGTRSGLAVTPAAASHFTVTGGSSETAGGVESLTVIARDPYGNVATDYAGTVHVTSTDGQAVLPPDATLTNGVGTFPVTLKTAGSGAITATDTVTPAIAGTESGLVVTSAAASSFSFITNSSIGSRYSIVVTALDAYDNVATGYAGPVRFTSDDPLAILPADVALVGGTGTFLVTFASAGTKTFTVTDASNPGLAGTDSIVVTTASSMGGELVSSAPQTFYGQSVTLTATFSATGVGGTPMTGTVSFYDGNTFLGTVSLVPNPGPLVSFLPNVLLTVSGTASLQTTALVVGDHVIRAVYSGDANYTSATSETPVSVQVLRTVTSATLTTAATPAGTVLTADVVVTSPGDPSTAGTVSFYEGSTLLGTAPVNDGVATLTIALLPAGQHSFHAVFSGGSNSAASDSSGLDTVTTGKVYLDLNADGSPTAGEPGLPGRVVFLDLNGDGTFNPGEPTTTTDSGGNFTLNNNTTGTGPVLEATDQDDSLRYDVAQSATAADGSVAIGVVPISPISPVKVVPSPFSANPGNDTATAFVQSLYQAVLGRTGGSTEVDAWLAKLGQGMTRQQVALGFLNSLEHRQDEVHAYYEEFLHRAPDPTSAIWVNELQAGVPEAKVVEGFLDSAEYQSEHQDATLFVRDLYIDVLGRQGESAGLASWQSALTSGDSREAIVAAFVESVEADDQMVQSFYQAFLHRPREQGTTSTHWVTMLESPSGSAAEAQAGILASAEYDRDATTSRN